MEESNHKVVQTHLLFLPVPFLQCLLCYVARIVFVIIIYLLDAALPTLFYLLILFGPSPMKGVILSTF